MLWFSCGVAVSIGEAEKLLLFEGVQTGKMTFCVAGVALGDILTSEKVSKLVLCDRCNTCASLSEDELDFSWQAQHFGDLHRHFPFRVAGATL